MRPPNRSSLLAAPVPAGHVNRKLDAAVAHAAIQVPMTSGSKQIWLTM
jgi:hypothetical protein